jgi:hypothetical protein
VFVLVGFANRTTDFIIIKPGDLLERLSRIHGKSVAKFQTYLWVTQQGRCYETRNLKRADQVLIATNNYANDARDFTGYLNDWTPIGALSKGGSLPLGSGSPGEKGRSAARRSTRA